MPALFATNPCKTMNQITAIEEFRDHLGDYRAQEAERVLVFVVIVQEEVVKVVVDAFPEWRCGGLPRPIDPGCPVCETVHGHPSPVSLRTYADTTQV